MTRAAAPIGAPQLSQRRGAAAGPGGARRGPLVGELERADAADQVGAGAGGGAHAVFELTGLSLSMRARAASPARWRT